MNNSLIVPGIYSPIVSDSLFAQPTDSESSSALPTSQIGQTNPATHDDPNQQLAKPRRRSLIKRAASSVEHCQSLTNFVSSLASSSASTNTYHRIELNEKHEEILKLIAVWIKKISTGNKRRIANQKYQVKRFLRYLEENNQSFFSIDKANFHDFKKAFQNASPSMNYLPPGFDEMYSKLDLNSVEIKNIEKNVSIDSEDLKNRITRIPLDAKKFFDIYSLKCDQEDEGLTLFSIKAILDFLDYAQALKDGLAVILASDCLPAARVYEERTGNKVPRSFLEFCKENGDEFLFLESSHP